MSHGRLKLDKFSKELPLFNNNRVKPWLNYRCCVKGKTMVITVRNEVAKVMFLQACVCPRGEYLTWYPPGTRCTPPDQVHPPQTRCTLPRPGTPPWDQVHPPPPVTRYPPRTRYTPRDQVHPPGPDTPLRTRYSPPARSTARWGIRSTCGRYASYWNAFLFV